MKVKMIVVCIIVVIIAMILFFTSRTSFNQKIERYEKGMYSYCLKGDMDLRKGEDVKKYEISVDYKKSKHGLFKVVFVDKEYNQEQMIVSNKDGIFVVTPSLNQIYKFKGDWPMNTPKPYLLQTIFTITQSKQATIQKSGSNYVVTSKVHYPTNENYDHEEIVFDHDAKVKWLKIYDKHNVEQLKIRFHRCDYNPKLKQSHFKINTNLERKVHATMVEECDLPLYPMNLYGSNLTSKHRYEQNNTIKHVLEYNGKHHFTIVQVKKQPVETTQTVIMPGNFIDAMDLVGYEGVQCVSCIHDGVEFMIYSQDLKEEEMLQVLSSMQVAVMK